MPTYKSHWTPEAIATMTRLLDEGYSYGQIAKHMGYPFTRCSLIGKAKRLGLCSPSTSPRKPKFVTSHPLKSCGAQRRVAVKRIPIPDNAPEPIGPLNDFPATHSCRYLHGTPGEGEWRCCGAPTISEKSSWCSFHFDRVRDKSAKPDAEAKAA